MSRELLLLVDALAREKNVEKDIVFGALEMALASATKKRFDEDVDVRVEIDRESGDYESFRRWQVVSEEDFYDPAYQMLVERASEYIDNPQEGDFIEEELEPIEFGRIGAGGLERNQFHLLNLQSLLVNYPLVEHFLTDEQ